ncbi:MAG: hypothetical protein ACRCST_03090 [Turicibacter sp.]
MNSCCDYNKKWFPLQKFCSECGTILKYPNPQEFMDEWNETHSWKMTIAVDFDATLSSAPYPDCGGLNKPLLDFLKDCQQLGANITLFTCRKDEPLQLALEWLKLFDFTPDYVNEATKEGIEMFGDSRKPDFSYLFDDKAIRVAF